MFEKFTRNARRVVERAEQEARALGHGWLGTEHLLLALLVDDHAAARVLETLGVRRDDLLEEYRGIVGEWEEAGSRVDPQALATVGIDFEEVRRAVDEAFGPGALEGTSTRRSTRRPRFTDHAKQVLERALREALGLGHRYLGAEHILLGLAAVTDGLAARLLAGRGASLPGLRAAVAEELRRSA